MKRILSIPLLLLSIGTYAQTAKQIVLTKGQEITIITNASGDADMGMGMTLTNTSNITSQMIVIGEDENNYSITKSLTNLKMSMEGLGQNMEFNSDNQEDKESEIGKKISAKINNPDTFLINKKTGKATSTKKDIDYNDNPAAISGIAMGNNEGKDGIEDAFFIINTDKKVGDTWMESSTNKKVTSKKTYTIKSIDKDIAVIEVKGSIEGETEQEMQGSTIIMNTESKIEGNITTNIKTGLVYMSMINADMTGNVNAMDQQMPITSKSTTTTLFNQ